MHLLSKMFSWLKWTKQWELRTVQGLICDICCLGIHQSSTVQTYQIYRLTEYIRYMFTMESLKGNLLIQIRLTFTYKTHRFYFSCICFNNRLPHSCGGLLGFTKCEWEKKRENMKSEGTIFEGKWKVICKVQMKSHVSYIGKRKGNCCLYRRKHFHYFLKS